MSTTSISPKNGGFGITFILFQASQTSKNFKCQKHKHNNHEIKKLNAGKKNNITGSYDNLIHCL
jgi:hypothetical protein